MPGTFFLYNGKFPNVQGVFLAFLTEGREKLFGAKVNKFRKTIIITIIDILDKVC